MCLEIYIGSKRKLELVERNIEDPMFYVAPLSHFGELNLIERILDSDYYYSVGSYTGCACGLSLDQHESNDVKIDLEKKRRDLAAFRAYLLRNIEQNDLKLFCTWWNNHAAIHPVKSFSPDRMNDPAFSFEEDVILQLEKSRVSA